jgi:hypothetical protein
MVRIELRDGAGEVFPLTIASGVELVPDVDASGADVIGIRDGLGRMVAAFRWDRVLSAAVERAGALG